MNKEIPLFRNELTLVIYTITDIMDRNNINYQLFNDKYGQGIILFKNSFDKSTMDKVSFLENLFSLATNRYSYLTSSSNYSLSNEYQFVEWMRIHENPIDNLLN